MTSMLSAGLILGVVIAAFIGHVLWRGAMGQAPGPWSRGSVLKHYICCMVALLLFGVIWVFMIAPGLPLRTSSIWLSTLLAIALIGSPILEIMYERQAHRVLD